MEPDLEANIAAALARSAAKGNDEPSVVDTQENHGTSTEHSDGDTPVVWGDHDLEQLRDGIPDAKQWPYLSQITDEGGWQQSLEQRDSPAELEQFTESGGLPLFIRRLAAATTPTMSKSLLCSVIAPGEDSAESQVHYASTEDTVSMRAAIRRLQDSPGDWVAIVSNMNLELLDGLGAAFDIPQRIFCDHLTGVDNSLALRTIGKGAVDEDYALDSVSETSSMNDDGADEQLRGDTHLTAKVDTILTEVLTEFPSERSRYGRVLDDTLGEWQTVTKSRVKSPGRSAPDFATTRMTIHLLESDNGIGCRLLVLLDSSAAYASLSSRIAMQPRQHPFGGWTWSLSTVSHADDEKQSDEDTDSTVELVLSQSESPQIVTWAQDMLSSGTSSRDKWINASLMLVCRGLIDQLTHLQKIHEVLLARLVRYKWRLIQRENTQISDRPHSGYYFYGRLDFCKYLEAASADFQDSIDSIRYVLNWPPDDGASEATESLTSIIAATTHLEHRVAKFLARLDREKADALQDQQKELTRLQIEESKASIHQNEKVRKLTVLAFIFIPISAITSAFGMNLAEIQAHPPPAWVFAVVVSVVTGISILLAGWSTLCNFYMGVIHAYELERSLKYPEVSKWELLKLSKGHRGWAGMFYTAMTLWFRAALKPIWLVNEALQPIWIFSLVFYAGFKRLLDVGRDDRELPYSFVQKYVKAANSGTLRKFHDAEIRDALAADRKKPKGSRIIQ